eukprot:Tamp_17240.p1 GENE.Tamp_17240~~Tamp_17240.p1  ORF type:complete len:453 (-),score=98.22 Tamp_17240:45-1370(-)
MQPWHVLFIMFFAVWLLADMFAHVELQHVINHDDAIYRRKDNFVDAEAFDELSAFVLQHPFVGNWTAAQESAAVVSMMHAWGHCNVNGFHRLCAKSDVRFLCEPFLKRVKEQGSNAFVLKLYAGYASDYDAAPSYFYSTLPLQGDGGPHIDDSRNRWVPKTVSILDVQVPKDMHGGQLQVFEDTNDEARDTSFANVAGPARMEPPAANTLHTLRGDTYYTFTDYSIQGLVADAREEMPAEFRRLSIVFEQYIIANSSYHGTSEYKLWKLHRDAERPVYAFGTVLWLCVGGVVGVAANARHLEHGNVLRVGLGALLGAGGGGAIGWSFAFAGLQGMKSFQDLTVFLGEHIYGGYYVYSPDFTVWFLVSASGAAFCTLLFWLFQKPILAWRKNKALEEATSNLSDFALGEGLTANQVTVPGGDRRGAGGVGDGEGEGAPKKGR